MKSAHPKPVPARAGLVVAQPGDLAHRAWVACVPFQVELGPYSLAVEFCDGASMSDRRRLACVNLEDHRIELRADLHGMRLVEAFLDHAQHLTARKSQRVRLVRLRAARGAAQARDRGSACVHRAVRAVIRHRHPLTCFVLRLSLRNNCAGRRPKFPINASV